MNSSRSTSVLIISQPRLSIFYGVSNNTRAFWSIENARRIIGYQPEDDSELRYASDIARLLGDSPGRLGPTAN
jgi:hypothetical protein